MARARAGSSDLLSDLMLLGLGAAGLYIYQRQHMSGTTTAAQVVLPKVLQTVTHTAPVTSPGPVGAPRGVRNNNPGNIKASLIPWQGQIGKEGPFIVFSSPVYGLRAMFKNLKSYINLHGLRTITQIEKRWTATDQGAWARNVATGAGLATNAPLSASNKAQMFAVVSGIIFAENGRPPWRTWYSQGQFEQAWGMS